VNILRDLPKDLAQGRCYLPVVDPADHEELMRCFARWRAVAARRMESGTAYAGKLRLKRLRMATALPAKIGAETLSLLGTADWRQLTAGIRIPRRRVYSLLLGSLLRG
jgi:farnesyl-diphosphate farnesyltransferase